MANLYEYYNGADESLYCVFDTWQEFYNHVVNLEFDSYDEKKTIEEIKDFIETSPYIWLKEFTDVNEEILVDLECNGDVDAIEAIEVNEENMTKTILVKDLLNLNKYGEVAWLF